MTEHENELEIYIDCLNKAKTDVEGAPENEGNWISYAGWLSRGGFEEEAASILRQANGYGHAGKAIENLKEEVEHSQREGCTFIALLTDGAYDQLEPRVRAWVEKHPYSPFGWKVLGAVYSNKGECERAVAPLTKAVDLDSKDAEARVNLANTLHELGNRAFGRRQWSEAESYYRRADQYHRVGDFRQVNIAACLYQQGEFAEAERLCLDVIGRTPNSAEAHNTLGAIYNETERYREAEPALRRAIDLKSDYAEAYVNLGIALTESGRFDDAQATVRRALALQPNSALAYTILAESFDREVQVADAQQAYDAAIAVDPCDAKALHGLASLLITKGEFDCAETLLRRAVEAAPDESGPWVALAHVRKMTRNDREWFDAAKRFLNTKLQLKQRVALNFALGKANDDIGEYGAAFAYYRQANDDAKALGPRYDPKQQEDRTDSVCATYTGRSVAAWSSMASDSERPLFIVGMPRSGTSLTEQIIASHPGTYGAGELRFWRVAATQCAPTVPERILDGALIKRFADECLANLERHSPTALRVVDKMPGNFNQLGLIHSVFPRARILHTLRNPIDTCLSIYFQNFNSAHAYAKDLNDLAHRYKEYSRMMKHWRDVLPPGMVLDIPYEELIEDQEGWSRRIIEFIGLDWDERCLDFHKTERRVGTASNWQARQPIYKTSKERWRNYEEYVGPLLPLLELYDPALPGNRTENKEST